MKICLICMFSNAVYAEFINSTCNKYTCSVILQNQSLKKNGMGIASRKMRDRKANSLNQSSCKIVRMHNRIHKNWSLWGYFLIFWLVATNSIRWLRNRYSFARSPTALAFPALQIQANTFIKKSTINDQINSVRFSGQRIYLFRFFIVQWKILLL